MSLNCVYAQRQSNRSTQAKRWAGEDAFRDSITVRNPHGLAMPYPWPATPAASPYLDGEWAAYSPAPMLPAPSQPMTEQRDSPFGLQAMWQDQVLANGRTPSSSPNSTTALYNDPHLQYPAPLDPSTWMQVAGGNADSDQYHSKPHPGRFGSHSQRTATYDEEQINPREFEPSGVDVNMDMLFKDSGDRVSRRSNFSRHPSGSPHGQDHRDYLYNLSPSTNAYMSPPPSESNAMPSTSNHLGQRSYDGVYMKQSSSSEGTDAFYTI